MRHSPYPTPAACLDPRLGAEATRLLGRATSPAVKAHLLAYLACRVQRTSFDRIDPAGAALPRRVRARLGQAARGRFSGGA